MKQEEFLAPEFSASAIGSLSVSFWSRSLLQTGGPPSHNASFSGSILVDSIVLSGILGACDGSVFAVGAAGVASFLMIIPIVVAIGEAKMAVISAIAMGLVPVLIGALFII